VNREEIDELAKSARRFFAPGHPASRNLIARQPVRIPRKRSSPPRLPSSTGAKAAAATFGDVRRVALALPGVKDGTSYGTPALKVGGKLIARVHQDMDCLVLRTDFMGREILMQSAPDTFFITEHYRDYPWILVRFAVVDKSAWPDLIERAWRLVAAKTLTKKYDIER
jgi:hypothetical protein